MLVSAQHDLVTFARSYRDYGKPDYARPGLNLRMNEFTAALGLVGTERLDEITAWKNAAARRWLDDGHPDRMQLPAGMVSGLYKYIVFPNRPLDGQGLRRPLSSHHGAQRGSPEQRLGGGEPLVRAPVLSAVA